MIRLPFTSEEQDPIPQPFWCVNAGDDFALKGKGHESFSNDERQDIQRKNFKPRRRHAMPSDVLDPQNACLIRSCIGQALLNVCDDWPFSIASSPLGDPHCQLLVG